jgi:adenine C2-methylase RlmN of 23S rRNA A2503 and tRNA A37
MCLNWCNQTGPSGEMVPYIRPLTTEEMIAQVYLAMDSPRIKKLFEKDSDKGLLVNFTGPGDALVNNLKNCSAMIEQLAEIKKLKKITEEPLVSFIITSVGREDRLKEYFDQHIRLPRVTHYWSVNSLDPKVRENLMPGTRGQSLERLRNLYDKIAKATRRPVTASWALFKGINDSPEEAERIADFFRNRPWFKVKLMAGCPDSMPNVPNIRNDDVLAFQGLVIKAGFDRVRVRKIFGADQGEYSGCGRTEADFIVRGSKF